MQEFLFPRLGMRHTFLRVPPAEMPDYAEGYGRDGKPIRMAPGVLSAQSYGVKSTAGDLLRYLEANMGLIRVNGLLWRALRATHTGYFTAGALTQDLAWEQYPYPAALKTLLAGNSPRMLFETVPAARLDPPEPPRGDVWINRTGGTNGFGAYVAFIPEKGLGIVILANRDFPMADRVRAAYDILAALGRGPESAPARRS